MLIEGKYNAPTIGLWKDPDDELPPEGMVVLGIGWSVEGFPILCFLTMEVEDNGVVSWYCAFDDIEHLEPWAWAEVRFSQCVGAASPGIDPELN